MNLDRILHIRARKRWQGYTFALIASGIAFGVRCLFFTDILQAQVPFLFFYISAGLSAWYGGFGPGMFATLCGALAAIGYTFKVPGFFDHLSAQVQVVLFILSGMIFSLLFETMHFDRKRVMYKRQLLEMEIAQRHKAQQSLVESDKKKNDFLAALAHELRSPLGAIANAAQLIRLADEKTRLSAAGIIERQAEQMKNLINDLTEAARISANKIELKKEPLELAEVIRRSIEGVRPLIDGRGHALTLQLPKEPLWVNGDPTRLMQIFMNIIANATKYTEPKGSIWIRLAQEGDSAKVCIADNGIGIAPNILPKIFDLYVQADSSLTQAQGGLGIGLNLVKRLTELHGGHVAARSPGLHMGSTFEVELPLIRAPEVMPEKSHSRLLNDKPHHCILIVDDNEASAETLAMMLEAVGNEVQVARNGRDAVRMAVKMKPDLVLLDIGLPEIDGYEVCRMLRREPSLRGTKIVAQTGWSLPEQKRMAQEAGFDEHLVKPIDLQALQDLLASFPGKNCPIDHPRARH